MFKLNIAGGFAAPIYKHSQMMEFTGVRLQTFRQWLRNGAFEAGITHDDKTKAYSLGDLLKIRLINELVIKGNLPVLVAVDAAELAGDWLEENHAKGGAVNAEAFLIAYPCGGPSIASNAADMAGILNANEGPATVIRLAKFLQTAMSCNGDELLAA